MKEVQKNEHTLVLTVLGFFVLEINCESDCGLCWTKAVQ